MGKGFEPTTEDDIRNRTGAVYMKGLLGGKSKIQRALSEDSRKEIFMPQTFDVMVFEGIYIDK